MSELKAEEVGWVIAVIVEATREGGVSASELAGRLGFRPAELHRYGLQALANITFEAGTEFQEACEALGVVEGLKVAVENLALP